jgi:hypothetical protein
LLLLLLLLLVVVVVYSIVHYKYIRVQQILYHTRSNYVLKCIDTVRALLKVGLELRNNNIGSSNQRTVHIILSYHIISYYYHTVTAVSKALVPVRVQTNITNITNNTNNTNITNNTSNTNNTVGIIGIIGTRSYSKQTDKQSACHFFYIFIIDGSVNAIVLFVSLSNI